MIDLNLAKEQFMAYLQQYNLEDSKIHLKAVHTFQVQKAAAYLCLHEKLCIEDTKLALLIALLHDIGRFEQLRLTGSFQDTILDHAACGVKILFEDGWIARFLPGDRQYDPLIRTAIACHALYSLPDGLTGRQLMHCRLLRDADKLDNFRVKETEDLQTLFDIPQEQIGMTPVSSHIMEAIRCRRCILSEERRTPMDIWVSWLAFTFDLNFPSSFRYLKNTDYIRRNFRRLSYPNPETAAAMEQILRILLSYVEDRAPQGPSCQAVIFDMDGLMFDSEAMIRRAWDKAGTLLGLGERFGDHILHTLGLNHAAREAYFRKACGEDFPMALFEETYRRLVTKEMAESGIPVKPGLYELLDYLQQKGCRTAVATSSSRKYTMEKLARAGVADRFACIICGDMVSCSKPDPEIYLTACQELQTAPGSALVLEDSENGLMAALNAGIPAIMIPDLIPSLPHIEPRLTAVLPDLSAVIDYLKELEA